MRLSRQFQDRLLLFFSHEKILNTQNAPKRKTNDFHLLRGLWVQKTVTFVVFCLLISVLLVNVCLWVFLCARNLFVKKIIIIIIRLEIVLIASFYYTIDVYPYQSPCQEFTLGAETFAEKNFRNFRDFCPVSRKFLPPKIAKQKIGKVFSLENKNFS